MLLKLLLAVPLIVLSLAATAQLHRYTGADGKTTYTERPCEGGERKSGVKIVDNSMDESELRDVTARSRAEPYATTDNPAQTTNRGRSSFECSTARRNYEVEGSIKTTPNSSNMERLRVSAEAPCGDEQSRNANHDVAIAQERAAAEKRECAKRAAEATAAARAAVQQMRCTAGPAGYINCW